MNNYSERAIKWMKVLGYLPSDGINQFLDVMEQKYNQFVIDITKSNELLIFQQLSQYTLEVSTQTEQQVEEQKLKIISQYMNIEQYQQNEQLYSMIEIDNNRILSKYEFLKNPCNFNIQQLFYTNNYAFKSNQKDAYSTTYLDVLKRILYIYCKLHPNIGYISGMNYLLAPIVQVIQKEADCYFCFELLIEKQQHLLLQSDNQKGLKATMNSFDEFIKNKEPQIYDHVNELGIILSLIFVRWFITLFTSDLDIQIVIELWDRMLVEEYQEYQFKIILELLRALKGKILKSNINQFLELISFKNENQVKLINSILKK
ncbi:unnamed protein product (macronuclear) [Paramecium tetraurelia]|uniref:Rab-GAP TBC domain-containing protein n=1 Tax=Paramecium tetraurelia TaxID=5888 RepID=A0DRU1_PARTE|nr:uncharacterized protein GSPATT00019476001 [Paramecium tetraurelia]CAK85758.1 unnamed protein product [Paramecium tetraurelia]|eukprot:XP_001453155.1 hypothetical protein (macronuclear) [Paramecium tetraurelia strain d4-2]